MPGDSGIAGTRRGGQGSPFMPTLNWIGKDAVVNHHLQVPFHLLRDVPELGCGEPGEGNLIVEGDNLTALKALLPYYAGQVKCIYIDPPYNTGNEGWVYNDNVKSPIITAWLGKAVGKEGETLDRHDRWLCMMYPRLAVLRQFLREDGVIFVSIDENEFATLHHLMDEIFGPQNFVGSMVWRNVTDNNPTNISGEHEYLLCYSRKRESLAKVWKTTSLPIKEKLLAFADEMKRKHPSVEQRQAAYTKWFRENKAHMWPFDRYKFIDDGGIYTGSQSVHNPGKEGYRYDVPHEKTGKPCQEPMMGYRFPWDTMQKLLADKRILFGEDESKIIELKLYVQDYKAKLPSVIEMDTRLGANELAELFPEHKRVFNFAKPSELIGELLSFATNPGDLILDSFAGSGTTGHAVLKLNAAQESGTGVPPVGAGEHRRDAGATLPRRFILVEMEPKIAREVTAERVRRVAEGYTNAKGGSVERLGGGFRYCTLGETLFDETGKIRETVRFGELARHVYFTETGEPLTGYRKADTGNRKEKTPAVEAFPVSGIRSPLLGVCRGVAIYLLYNGILGDKTANGGNVLTRATLAKLPPFDGPKVIYCAGCLLGRDRLAASGIVVRQTPYEIKVT